MVLLACILCQPLSASAQQHPNRFKSKYECMKSYENAKDIEMVKMICDIETSTTTSATIESPRETPPESKNQQEKYQPSTKKSNQYYMHGKSIEEDLAKDIEEEGRKGRASLEKDIAKCVELQKENYNWNASNQYSERNRKDSTYNSYNKPWNMQQNHQFDMYTEHMMYNECRRMNTNF